MSLVIQIKAHLALFMNGLNNLKIAPLVSAIILAFTVSCSNLMHSNDNFSINAKRFNNPNAINLKLEDDSRESRIDALRTLLHSLGNNQSIDASTLFEHGRIIVTTELGGEDSIWKTDFHIVFPDPLLDNQSFAIIKFISWTTAKTKGDASYTAQLARNKGLEQLREAVKKLIAPNQPLNRRISILGEPVNNDSISGNLL